METMEGLKHALKRLTPYERDIISNWLQDPTNTSDRIYRVEEPQHAHAPVPPPFMTLDEFMEFEENSQFRHEYVNGAVHAMSGPSVAHVRITGELFVALKAHLRGRPCEPFATDLKLMIHLDTDEIVYYPAMTYRRVTSIEEYALLEQYEHRISVHRRSEGWKPQVYEGPQAVAEFRSVGLAVPLAQIYEGTLSVA